MLWLKTSPCSADWAFCLSFPCHPSPLPNQKQHQSNQNGNVRHEWGPSPLLLLHLLLLLLHETLQTFFLSMLEGGSSHPLFSLKMEASTTKLKEAEEEEGERKNTHSNTNTRMWSQDSGPRRDSSLDSEVWLLCCYVAVLHTASLMGLTATNQGAAAPSAHKLHSTGNGIDESQAEGKQAPNNSNKTQGNEWRNKNRPIFPEFFFLLMWGSCVRCCRAGTDRRGGAAAAGGAWWSPEELEELAAVLNTTAASSSIHPSIQAV